MAGGWARASFPAGVPRPMLATDKTSTRLHNCALHLCIIDYWIFEQQNRELEKLRWWACDDCVVQSSYVRALHIYLYGVVRCLYLDRIYSDPMHPVGKYSLLDSDTNLQNTGTVQQLVSNFLLGTNIQPNEFMLFYICMEAFSKGESLHTLSSDL
jgi:hypothetical protein